jgi:Flp pilus assembly protein TadG
MKTLFGPHMSAVTLSSLGKAAQRFRDDKSGALAIIFALTLLPLLLLVGSALDYSRTSDDRARFQRAADAAVIAAARQHVADADRARIAEQAFNGTLTPAQQQQVTAKSFTVDPSTTKVTVQVDAATPTTILKVAGWQTMPLRVYAEGIIAKPQIRQLDLAMCIDATASMDATLNAVKSNALNFDANLNAELQRRGIDPFDAMRVRVIFFRDYGGNSYWNASKTPGDYVIGVGQQWVWVPWSTDPLRYRNVGDIPAMRVSQFWSLPADRTLFSTFVQPETAWGGGDAPESGLECANEAMDSPWARVGDLTPSGKKLSQVYPVIAVWTMSEAHPPAWPLSLTNPDYPPSSKMPRAHSGLLMKWNDATKIDQVNRMLVFFGDPINPEDGKGGNPNGWLPLTKWPGFMQGGTLTQGTNNMVIKMADAIAAKLSTPILSH